MKNFIARQPIFDMHMDVYAYELLYRRDDTHNFFDDDGVGKDQATSETVMESFQGVGLEKITGGRRAFINFTFNLIEQDVATLFPKEHLIIEVLEDTPPSLSVVEKLRALKEMGYLIVLGHQAFRDDRRALLELADIIKIDFLALSAQEIRDMLGRFDLRGVRLLAEKVETLDMFETSKSLGFTFFQGYFFAKPIIVSTRRMDPLRINYLQLVRRVNQEELDFTRLAKVIRRDVALSYKMLKLVNSTYYGRRSEIMDIKHALVILGEKEIRKWISLVAMVGCSEKKPDELIRESMMRARFMEIFGMQYGMAQDIEALFLTGLFSLIDVVMETPMDELIASLSVPEAVEEALVCGKGKAAELLRVICTYEQGDWEESARLCEALQVPSGRLPELYMDAVRWCNEMLI